MSNETTKVAAVAMHSEMGEPDANLKRVEYWARKAHAKGATFVLFTEECITGSMNKSNLATDQIHSIARNAHELAVPFLESLCYELSMTLVVGTIEPVENKLRNSAYIVGPEGLLATFSKIHLPGNENNWFLPGDSLQIISSQGWTFSVGICFDARFPEIFRAAAYQGAEFFLLAVGASGRNDLVAANGDQTEQAKAHKDLNMKYLSSRAVDNGMYVINANQAGKSGNAWFPGLAQAIDPSGNLIAEHMPNEGMIVVEISREAISEARSSLSCTLSTSRPAVYLEPTIIK